MSSPKHFAQDASVPSCAVVFLVPNPDRFCYKIIRLFSLLADGSSSSESFLILFFFPYTDNSACMLSLTQWGTKQLAKPRMPVCVCACSVCIPMQRERERKREAVNEWMTFPVLMLTWPAKCLRTFFFGCCPNMFRNLTEFSCFFFKFSLPLSIAKLCENMIYYFSFRK